MSSPARPRHEPLLKIASGGMATVFLGTLEGGLGFRPAVAIKRPHPHLLEHAGFRDALLREARLASSVHHANVVDVRDVEVVGDAVQLVMDYVEGASLSELGTACAAAGERLPAGIAVRVALDACAGLHAAHEARDDDGRPMGLVHRDVSPQNLLVGADGVARVTDFGIAKCVEASDPGTSRETLKGKLGYMAPEVIRGEAIDRRADVFGLGVVLWESLTGKRLFRAPTDGETLERVLSGAIAPVSETDASLAPLDAIVARAVARDRGERYASTEALATELEKAAATAGLVATPSEVGALVRRAVGDRLEERRRAWREAKQDAAPEVSPAMSPAANAAAVTPPAQATTRPEPRPKRTRWPLAVASLALASVASAAIVLLVGVGPRGVSALASASVPPASAGPDVTPSAASPPAPSSLPSALAAVPALPATPAPSIASAAPSSAPAKASPRPRPGRGTHAPPPNPYPAGATP